MTGSRWGRTPQESIEAECARRGRDAVVAGCVQLLAGRDADPDLLRALGGPGADKFLDGRPHDDTYWLRVWGARGLLWAWDDEAAPAVQRALGDEAWRVREMAARVAARHLVGDAVPRLAELRDDPVPRVRQAATRALATLTGHGA
jgi:hypothetical protein